MTTLLQLAGFYFLARKDYDIAGKIESEGAQYAEDQFQKRTATSLQALSKRSHFIDVPEMNFLMIDGKGDPNSAPAFQAAVETLFALSYALKFMIKKGAAQIDYGVMPLEGIWWTEDMATFSVKKKQPALSLLRFESFSEGKVAQYITYRPLFSRGADNRKGSSLYQGKQPESVGKSS